ncbi:MAG: LamG domain-containing protein [Proteobacteria bacterium]|nr:LamG domain-containing protein [Pseudomonadota bacterium]
MKKILFMLLLLASVSRGQWTGVKPPLGTPLNRSNNLSVGLVGFWPFIDTPGVLGTTYDLSGNGNHGTLVGDTHSVPGKFGSCLSFDGADDYIQATGPPDITDSITYIMWIHLDVIGIDMTPLRVYDSIYNIDGTANAVQWFADVDLAVASKHFTWVADVWYQLAVTHTGIAYNLYVNGVSIGGGDSVALDLVSSYGTHIGSFNTTGTWDLNGQIDHVMIYNRALSAGDVTSLYADSFQMFEQPRLPIASAAAPPAGNPQVITIIMSSLPYWIVPIMIIGLALGLRKRDN